MPPWLAAKSRIRPRREQPVHDPGHDHSTHRESPEPNPAATRSPNRDNLAPTPLQGGKTPNRSPRLPRGPAPTTGPGRTIDLDSARWSRPGRAPLTAVTATTVVLGSASAAVAAPTTAGVLRAG